MDPKKVTRTALQNAASIAGLLLTATLRRHTGVELWVCGSAHIMVGVCKVVFR